MLDFLYDVILVQSNINSAAPLDWEKLIWTIGEVKKLIFSSPEETNIKSKTCPYVWLTSS